ncbi:hypothetical protein [Shinella sp. JR1-6]|uniref:hypothetical protein n=1 Tax=Shinella sp. JR1-6 TaxID=2527671 RepID=UPI00102D43FB|nr:hypothetical protein [Shinella sp. JR1-6]TAA49790.1 hypothetical protein EXZ48_33885 [Shinella sp. JR1-6]
MHRSQFCTARETILTKLAASNGFYFEEGDRHGKVYESLRHAVTRLTADNAAAYFRFDLDTLSAEDITEEFASEWLNTFKGSPEDEDQLPTYVRTSQAWDDWCSDFTVENGLAFTQRSHGTLNHRQQFGA